MSLFAGLLGKIASTAAGGFLKSYGTWIIAGLLAAFLAWYVWSAERAKTKVVTLEAANAELVQEKKLLLDTIDMNKAALEECLAANAQNALQAVREAQRVRAAQNDVAAMRREMLAHMDRDRIESEELRGRDQECRTVDESLPAWFVDGLRDEPEGYH